MHKKQLFFCFQSSLKAKVQEKQTLRKVNKTKNMKPTCLQ